MEFSKFMYHTQENRGHILTEPMLCSRSDAWLGSAYYFWGDEGDAIRWGYDSKKGHFQVYLAKIESNRVLDTVFNQEHYIFFIKALERVAVSIAKKTGHKLSKRLLCEYLNEKVGWKKEIDVLIVNDNPDGAREIFPIPIRKRIQAAVYNKECIHDFRLSNSYD